MILKILLFFALVLAVAKPLGVYMARLFSRTKTYAVERTIYRLTGVDETREQSWTAYTIAMLVFSAVTLVLTYAIERLQHLLPLNPDKLGANGVSVERVRALIDRNVEGRFLGVFGEPRVNVLRLNLAVAELK